MFLPNGCCLPQRGAAEDTAAACAAACSLGSVCNTAEGLSGPRGTAAGWEVIRTIFFGGGTPSLMQPATVGGLLDAIGRHWPIAPDVEVTLEANPTSVEATRFRGYRAAGVNRVSLGVQALDDAALKELGRLHSAQEALAAVGVARTIFDRYSFDLIYARPQQTPGDWAVELKRAIAEAAEHLSLYQLTIEQDTPFFTLHAAGKLVVPNEDAARTLTTTQDICSGSAGSRPRGLQPRAAGRRVPTIWSAGARTNMPDRARRPWPARRRRRALRHRDREAAEAWLMRVESLGYGLVTDEVLTPEQMADEFLLMGLRLAEGVDPARYARLAGRTLDPRRVAVLSAEGAVETTPGGRLRVTRVDFRCSTPWSPIWRLERQRRGDAGSPWYIDPRAGAYLESLQARPRRPPKTRPTRRTTCSQHCDHRTSHHRRDGRDARAQPRTRSNSRSRCAEIGKLRLPTLARAPASSRSTGSCSSRSTPGGRRDAAGRDLGLRRHRHRRRQSAAMAAYVKRAGARHRQQHDRDQRSCWYVRTESPIKSLKDATEGTTIAYSTMARRATISRWRSCGSTTARPRRHRPAPCRPR